MDVDNTLLLPNCEHKTDIKTPFLIGVAGGTASGKVSMPMERHCK